MTQKYIDRLELFLEQNLNQYIIPAEPIRSAIHYSLFPGGKRIRPILVYLTGELLEVELNVLDVIAGAIELTHCYSLVHDDLPAMDDDDFRRGKPSCHKAFDEATAILVGDGMQALAIEILLTRLPELLTPSQTIAITRALVKASGVGGMVSGQSLDLTVLSQPCVSDEQLREVHHLKTGRLISACIEMVIAAQNTPKEPAKALRTYASHIGLVFQMQDDYLDRYAPENTLGKGRASDKANNKNTFAALYLRKQLEEEILKHYQIAITSLALFDNKVEPLIRLTRQLQERTRLLTFPLGT